MSPGRIASRYVTLSRIASHIARRAAAALAASAAAAGGLAGAAPARSALRLEARGTANPIQAENARPGTTAWQLPAASDTELYASAISALPGANVELHVSTVDRYRIAVYRLGWYAGTGARLVACLPGCTSDEQGHVQPAPAAGEPIRANWPVTDVLHTGTDWVTGYYLIEAVGTSGADRGRAAVTYVILRAPPVASPSSILVEVPVNTWEAYNQWGGKSLYDFGGPRAHAVSFDRPFGTLAQSPLEWEIQLVRFLEREGYDVSYQTDVDTDRDGASLLRHRLVVVAGHDEYWSHTMRNAFDTALAHGTNLAFFGSNDGYWQISYSDGRRTIVSYKSLSDPNPVLAQKTAMFRQIGRPECMLMGVQHTWFARLDHPLDYQVTSAGAADPWLAGTGLHAGDTIVGVVGREHDKINPYPAACFKPGLVDLFHYDGRGVDQDGDAIRYTAPSGARVFASGAQRFSWALDGWRSNGTLVPTSATSSGVPVDPRVQRFVRNALDDLTRPAAPAGLKVRLRKGVLTVRVRRPVDARVTGFVAALRRGGGRWQRLCHGTTSCSHRVRTGKGRLEVGVVALDSWHRSSAAAYALVQR